MSPSHYTTRLTGPHKWSTTLTQLILCSDARQIAHLIVAFIRKVRFALFACPFLSISLSSSSLSSSAFMVMLMLIGQIDFGRDLEKQLGVYVDCRQAFTNLDHVTTELVLRVALLATKAHK